MTQGNPVRRRFGLILGLLTLAAAATIDLIHREAGPRASGWVFAVVLPVTVSLLVLLVCRVWPRLKGPSGSVPSERDETP